MLLDKFQRDHEKQQSKEEEMHEKEEHWKCPFFVHCWEEGLTLPMVDDCPECNNLYHGGQSYKKPRFDDGPRRPMARREHTPVHDRLGGKISVHDRLGGRTMLRDPAGGRIHVHYRLERMADDRVLDDQLMRRDPEREPVTRRASQSRWCPTGLTKSQKRCVQRLRQLELIEEEEKQTLNRKGFKSQIWCIKPKADDQQDSSSSAAPINMVFMMPREFMASVDSDEESELEEAVAQLALEPVPATFEKPEDEK
jgi:hypothetical protein